MNAITIGQCFYLLNSRYLIDNSLSISAHFGNKYLPMGIGAVVVLQLLFTDFTPLQRMFDTEAVPLYVWPWRIAGGFVFFLIVEAEKLVISMIPQSEANRHLGGSRRPEYASDGKRDGRPLRQGARSSSVSLLSRCRPTERLPRSLTSRAYLGAGPSRRHPGRDHHRA